MSATAVQSTSISADPWIAHSPVQRFRVRPTLRLFAVAGLCVFLISVPVWRSADIVAAVLSTILLTFTTAIVLCGVISTIILRRQFRPEILLPAADPTAPPPAALVPISLIYRVPAVRLWPMITFEWQLLFTHAAMSGRVHRTVTPTKTPQTIGETFLFPHRGEWSPRGIHCQVQDQFGLLQCSWIFAAEETRRPVRVHPFPGNADTFPILSSCERPGDEVTHRQERRGDYFDFKPYHPSDGVKRIIWKMYARNGELVARQPEAAMNPEGEVVVFIVADPHADTAASIGLAYIERLAGMELDIIAAVAGTALPAATSPSEIRDQLIESTWEINLTDSEKFKSSVALLCNTIRGRNALEVFRRVVVFVAADSVANPETHRTILEGLSDFVNHGAVPVILTAQSPFISASTTKESAAPGPRSRWRRLLVQEPELVSAPSERARQAVDEFFQACAARGWDVIREREQAW